MILPFSFIVIVVYILFDLNKSISMYAIKRPAPLNILFSPLLVLAGKKTINDYLDPKEITTSQARHNMYVLYALVWLGTICN